MTDETENTANEKAIKDPWLAAAALMFLVGIAMILFAWAGAGDETGRITRMFLSFMTGALFTLIATLIVIADAVLRELRQLNAK